MGVANFKPRFLKIHVPGFCPRPFNYNVVIKNTIKQNCTTKPALNLC